MGHQSSKQNVNVFHQAVRNGNLDKVKELLQQDMPLEDQDDVFGTPLHEAVCFGRHEIAELLLQHKVDVNSAQKNTMDTGLCITCKKGWLPMVELLLQAQAKVNLAGQNARTPLHYALENGNEEVAIYLLEHGANANITDAQGDTSLHVACRKQCIKATQAITSQAGINMDVHNKSHMTPLMYGCQLDDLRLVEMLLRSKAKVRYSPYLPTPLHVVHSVACARLILDAGADVNTRDDTNCTALHNACGIINNYDVVQLFIEHSADVNARDKNLSTPLHKACQGGALRNVQILLRNGADVHAIDYQGCSPLHVASKMGYAAVSKVLIEYGANPHLMNGEGFTPTQLALCAED